MADPALLLQKEKEGTAVELELQVQDLDADDDHLLKGMDGVNAGSTIRQCAVAEGFGGKTIGFFGSFCLILNNIVGNSNWNVEF